MYKYNTKRKYNYKADEGGAIYNSARVIFLIRIFDSITASDDFGNILATNIVREKANVFDDLAISAVFNAVQGIKLNDSPKPIAIISVADKLNIKDDMIRLIVSLYLKDNIKALDEIKAANALLEAGENITMDDIPNVDALISALDDFGFSEFLNELVATIRQYEYPSFTDKKPRTETSNFVIGKNENLDEASTWFFPLEMIVDEKESEIQLIPQTESTYIDMPYMDGSIVENTVYKNKLFNLVLWSKDGLTEQQKDELKADIVRLLDSTKDQPKKMTIQRTGISYDVKYSGAASVREAPSFIKAVIPLESKPYGYPLFEQEIYGNGLLVNNGDKDSGCINEIAGGCVNPSFQIGSVSYSWNGTVPLNSKLVINHNNMTCYIMPPDGKKIQAINELTGEFQTIKKNSTIQIVASEGTKDYLTTKFQEKILWDNR